MEGVDIVELCEHKVPPLVPLIVEAHSSHDEEVHSRGEEGYHQGGFHMHEQPDGPKSHQPVAHTRLQRR